MQERSKLDMKRWMRGSWMSIAVAAITAVITDGRNALAVLPVSPDLNAMIQGFRPQATTKRDLQEFFVVIVFSQDGRKESTLCKPDSQGLPLEIFLNSVNDKPAKGYVSVQTDAGICKIDCDFGRHSGPGVLYVTYHQDHYLSVFLNGDLVAFKPVKGKITTAGDLRVLGETGVILPAAISTPEIKEMAGGLFVPSFSQRYQMHRLLGGKYGVAQNLYPVFQYYNPLIGGSKVNVRDPSEILHIGSRYYVYFTLTPAKELDGFRGSIYASSCSDQDDPSKSQNWSPPVEVIVKGAAKTDFDGTGCFTPDCYYDGSNVFIFYTALNSTHPKGFPQWNEPEQILVAKSGSPVSGFVKTPIHTPLQSRRALGYDEATVPGGHEVWQGQKAYDVSLIDHGQCWVMDDGERRYYYKGGGGAGPGPTHGAVCVVRGLDADWLNGHRQAATPILLESSHLEGILITRMGDQMFLQLQIFGRAIGEWVTYVSDAKDGLNWKFIGGAHRPKLDNDYALSIGVNSTSDPYWGIGQFPDSEGWIQLAYLRVL